MITAESKKKRAKKILLAISSTSIFSWYNALIVIARALAFIQFNTLRSRQSFNESLNKQGKLFENRIAFMLYLPHLTKWFHAIRMRFNIHRNNLCLIASLFVCMQQNIITTKNIWGLLSRSESPHPCTVVFFFFVQNFRKCLFGFWRLFEYILIILIIRLKF